MRCFFQDTYIPECCMIQYKTTKIKFRHNVIKMQTLLLQPFHVWSYDTFICIWIPNSSFHTINLSILFIWLTHLFVFIPCHSLFTLLIFIFIVHKGWEICLVSTTNIFKKYFEPLKKLHSVEKSLKKSHFTTCFKWNIFDDFFNTLWNGGGRRPIIRITYWPFSTHFFQESNRKLLCVPYKRIEKF